MHRHCAGQHEFRHRLLASDTWLTRAHSWPRGLHLGQRGHAVLPVEAHPCTPAWRLVSQPVLHHHGNSLRLSGWLSTPLAKPSGNATLSPAHGPSARTGAPRDGQGWPGMARDGTCTSLISLSFAPGGIRRSTRPYDWWVRDWINHPVTAGRSGNHDPLQRKRPLLDRSLQAPSAASPALQGSPHQESAPCPLKSSQPSSPPAFSWA